MVPDDESTIGRAGRVVQVGPVAGPPRGAPAVLAVGQKLMKDSSGILCNPMGEIEPSGKWPTFYYNVRYLEGSTWIRLEINLWVDPAENF
jgi:hypothetical protein